MLHVPVMACAQRFRALVAAGLGLVATACQPSLVEEPTVGTVPKGSKTDNGGAIASACQGSDSLGRSCIAHPEDRSLVPRSFLLELDAALVPDSHEVLVTPIDPHAMGKDTAGFKVTSVAGNAQVKVGLDEKLLDGRPIRLEIGGVSDNRLVYLWTQQGPGVSLASSRYKIQSGIDSESGDLNQVGEIVLVGALGQQGQLVAYRDGQPLTPATTDRGARATDANGLSYVSVHFVADGGLRQLQGSLFTVEVPLVSDRPARVCFKLDPMCPYEEYGDECDLIKEACP